MAKDNSLSQEKTGCIDDSKNLKHPMDDSFSPPFSEKNVWFEENIADYQNLISSFQTAELDIKQAEVADKQNNGVLIPAMNELRYCSYHIIKAINTVDQHEQKEQLHRATRHCERASYDALELGLATLVLKIGEFQNKYASKKVIFASVITDYANDMALVRQSQELLEGNYKDKNENFKAIRKKLSEIKKIYFKLQEAETDIQTQLKHNDRKFYFACLGLIVSTVIAISGWYKVITSEGRITDMQQQLQEMQKKIIDMHSHSNK